MTVVLKLRLAHNRYLGNGHASRKHENSRDARKSVMDTQDKRLRLFRLIKLVIEVKKHNIKSI